MVDEEAYTDLLDSVVEAMDCKKEDAGEAKTLDRDSKLDEGNDD